MSDSVRKYMKRVKKSSQVWLIPFLEPQKPLLCAVLGEVRCRKHPLEAEVSPHRCGVELERSLVVGL